MSSTRKRFLKVKTCYLRRFYGLDREDGCGRVGVCTASSSYPNSAVACESEKEEGWIASARAPAPEQGAPVVRKERHGGFHTVESRDFAFLEERLGLDLKMILKKRQQQKFTMKRVLKAAEAAPIREGGLTICEGNFRCGAG